MHSLSLTLYAVDKIKKDLIHKAKVKKAYKKIKQKEFGPAKDNGDDAATEQEQMHPTRKLMIKDEDKAQEGVTPTGKEASGDGQRRRTRRPGYYDKQLAKADERSKEADQRRQEWEQRQAERAEKIAEREKYKRAMAKTVGRDGKKKLGRESGLLLDKVKKMMAQGK